MPGTVRPNTGVVKGRGSSANAHMALHFRDGLFNFAAGAGL
jgi:hypothetical protein